MKTLSLKLKDAFFEETEGILKKRRIPGNRYIAEAVEFYNRYHKQKELAKAFAKASTLARESYIADLPTGCDCDYSPECCANYPTTEAPIIPSDRFCWLRSL